MATAVSGSAMRATSCQFRDRAKIGGVLGQSPLPKRERRARLRFRGQKHFCFGARTTRLLARLRPCKRRHQTAVAK